MWWVLVVMDVVGDRCGGCWLWWMWWVMDVVGVGCGGCGG